MKQTKCYCGHTSYCDCGPLEEPKQSTKDRIMSETSEETKQKARDYGNSLVNKQEQDKNLYSEEEVYIMIAKGIKENGHKLLNFFDESYYNPILLEWFEQFKKK